MSAAGRPAQAALARLLRPRSVAIVGASPTPGALGASVLANLVRMGYQGDIYLINPKHAEISGRRCFKSADQLPADVDAAVLAIPRVAVLDAVSALARRQVGAAVIFSAGFAEAGEQGLSEQREIAAIAHAHGMVIEGPNCLGFVNYVDNVALTFIEPPSIPLGDGRGIGIVSQSGAMASVLSVMLASRELRMSYSVSTGNEAASGVEDYLEYLIEDPRTRAIALIVEQFRQPRRFLDIAARTRQAGKTIVLLHPGRCSAARESAATHTGALAGDYALMITKVERQGVVIAETLEELGDILEIDATCNARPAGGVLYITESGAFKALTLDLCEQISLPLPVIDDQSAPQLRAAIPEFVPVSNPLDLTAQALVDPDLYRRTLAAVIDDQRFACMVLGIIQCDLKLSNIKFASIIGALRELKPAKAVIYTGLDEGAVVGMENIRQLRALGVPCFPSPDRALRALARLNAAAAQNPASPAAALAAPRAGTPLPAGVVPEYRAKQILAPLGIPFPVGRFVHDLDEAQRAAAEIGFPVALKAQSPELSHKSDVGGVVLNLADAAALSDGWGRLHVSIAEHRPGLMLDGVLIEKMARRGVELIVGARVDPDWGPVMMVGFGGVQAEILKDIRLLTPDMTPEEIGGEIYQLRGAPLLKGFRGSPPLDVRAVAGIIAQLGQWLLVETSVLEIDMNPVIVYPIGEGALALDALLQVGAH